MERICSTLVSQYSNDTTNRTSFSISNSGDVYEVSFCARKKIKFLSNISSICTSVHTVCLDAGGNIYTFGSNSSGQLGRTWNFNTIICAIKSFFAGKFSPYTVYNIPPIKQVSCGSNFTVCVTEDGHVYSFGSNKHGQLGLGDNLRGEFNINPCRAEVLQEIDFVACGGLHTICKTFYGEIYVFGLNFHGQYIRNR